MNFFTVKVNDLRLAIPMQYIKEVQLAVAVSRTVSRSGYFDGAFECRGALIPLFNIRACLGLKAGPLSPFQYFLILCVDDLKFAIVIDEILGTTHISNDELTTAQGVSESFGTPILKKLNTEIISICDLSALVTSDIQKEFQELMFASLTERNKSAEE
jgi:chemotaxis signal transduction protein